ncbi:hypothetical protein T05_8816 [Trichinella murrelli]|uniref:Uncharacterized protein n=1 Tax=Trichinella murrelli TaxID=144512 RepID=A0A0V0TBN1_9BILA|nr:hypothetical protein T05_8816 [Trichinella murrelli]
MINKKSSGLLYVKSQFQLCNACVASVKHLICNIYKATQRNAGYDNSITERNLLKRLCVLLSYGISLKLTSI